MKRLLLTSLLLSIPLNVHAISAEFMEGQFEPVMNIPKVDSIEAWQQPKTQYTPKNLRSEYQIRYSGTDTNGRNAYSYTTHFTDYDTYIVKNGITEDGKYYVQDNTGKGYVTGEHVDLEPIQHNIQNVNNQLNNVNKAINTAQQEFNTINNNMQNIKAGMNSLKDGLYTLNDRVNHGLATVTALTGLHPNPRSKEKLEVSTSFGMYQSHPAGAIGLFYHPNDRIQLSIGAAYGGCDSWAGSVGATFSIGGKRQLKNNKHGR